MSQTRVTVLGSSGAWPEPGRACSGFLVQHDGFGVVVDLGYATLPRLLQLLGSQTADGLGAVVVTHHHLDHAADLHPLFRARWFGARGSEPIPVHAPPEVRQLLRQMETEEPEALDVVFCWLPPGDVEVGPFRVRTWEVPHFVPSIGVRLEVAGAVIAFTGDTGPDPVLTQIGSGADLFVVDATDRSQRPGRPLAPPPRDLLLDADQAGEVAAAAAGAARLLLTHFWPGNDRELARSQAAARFAGPVLVAEEGLVVDLTGGSQEVGRG